MSTAAQTYHTPASLAKLWGCCIESVYDLLRAGKLRGFKIGKDWRIPDAARAEYEANAGAEPPKSARLRGRGKIITRIT